MSIILHIETATKNCSVALSRSGEMIALEEHYAQNYSHSEQLHDFILKVLRQAQTKISELDAVAVSKGPGSYTGLRIGVAAAKGICFAQDLPLIAINSLQILAGQYGGEPALLFPMFDARRMEVYVMVLDERGKVVQPAFAEVITANSFKVLARDKKWIFMGEGSEKCKAIFKGAHIQYRSDIQYPSAQHMIPLAWRAFQEQKFEDVAYFEPFYLKDFYTTAKKTGS
ncbi:MAG: tRNA (adenosine(37)-N6)-threonylcarbamoyltransferase complex dimerization subunit type 1 TsaB [Flavobacteriia bacterium]|nr:tRNA (adenosine(37)-N6)-threonylcarbamoyltransferase complex dimerization subunit type 1 TsaB [Flavobacteriia bacterium]